MRAATVLAARAAAALAMLIAHALIDGRFRQEGGVLLAIAWGKLTLADLYVGFGLFSGWVIFR